VLLKAKINKEKPMSKTSREYKLEIGTKMKLCYIMRRLRTMKHEYNEEMKI